MQRDVGTRPSWWLLYVIAAAMVAMIALVETSVPSERARVTLEVPAVVGLFAAMLRWLSANRGRIELAETPPTRWNAVEALVPKSAAGIKMASKSDRPPPLLNAPAPPDAATAVHSMSSWPNAGPIPTSSSSASENRRRGGGAAS